MTGWFSRRRALGAMGFSLLAGPGLAAGLTRSLVPQARPEHLGKPALAATPPKLAAVINEARLSGTTAAVVIDVKSGETLEAHGASTPLPPASVIKSVTALYALAHLGASHRFSTRLLAGGPIKNGVLMGDLWLVGGGDPTLDSAGLMTLARALKASGLTEVRGRFVVSSGGFTGAPQIDEAQPAHVAYNPSVSGLALNFNRVRFEWKRAGSGYALSMDARAKGLKPAVAGITMTLAERALPVYEYSGAQQRAERWSVARAALGKAGARWLPVRRPEAYAAEVFATLARAHGITLPRAEVRSGTPTNAAALAAVQSAPLAEILRGMLKYSTNLTAEMVGIAASTRAAGAAPASLRASARQMSNWAKQELGMQSAALQDHSGLSGKSRLSARDLARGLAAARARVELRALMKPVFLRDAKGRPLRNSPVKIAAKTGTLNFVSGLGGFVTTAAGRELCFVIVSADIARRAALRKDERERPSGGRRWARRARALQHDLLARWSTLFTA